MRTRSDGFAFTTVETTISLFVFALLLISPVVIPSKSVEAEGVYLVKVTWPDVDVDVDLYLQEPNGKVTYFASDKSERVYLTQDDLGFVGDAAGGNEERVTVRATLTGEYIVGIHAYRGGGVRARVQLYKLRGPDRQIAQEIVSLPRQGSEGTAFRFTLNDAGSVASMSRLPKRLVGATNA